MMYNCVNVASLFDKHFYLIHKLFVNALLTVIDKKMKPLSIYRRVSNVDIHTRYVYRQTSTADKPDTQNSTDVASCPTLITVGDARCELFLAIRNCVIPRSQIYKQNGHPRSCIETRVF